MGNQLVGRENTMDLSFLTPKERQILYLRTQNSTSITECAKRFGVTKERIRQIEAKALRKIKQNSGI